MPLEIPEGFAQCSLPFTHTGLGRKAVVTMAAATGAAGGDISAMCDDILASFNDLIVAFVDSEVVCGPVAASAGAAGGTTVPFVGTDTVTGGVTQASNPANVALLVQKLTSDGGRSGRGRFYWPWLLADSVVNELGFIDGGVVTSLQTAFDSALDTLSTEPTAPGMWILHQVGSGLSASAVTSLVVDNQIGTQRRRLART